MAVAPAGRAVAVARSKAGRSELVIVDGGRDRRVFSGQGVFTGVAWSPDGRWLLVAWEDADQWVFIRSARVSRIRAYSQISSQFESPEAFPVLAGWCCPD
jgi:hypothetical protein